MDFSAAKNLEAWGKLGINIAGTKNPGFVGAKWVGYGHQFENGNLRLFDCPCWE